MADNHFKESAKFQLAQELGGLELIDAKYKHQNFLAIATRAIPLG
ncbi:hypothetical protein VSVS05_03713 [Vibrio scophthalmi]|uniref:Uncharacterized protein n=1 Tax=Vibrio scophthalmi TaxID=45658 RepID=A0A1C7FIB4_9VIBR|nr:hypothetical protein VSVS05_03713 [Vibrio scophthalmi]